MSKTKTRKLLALSLAFGPCPPLVLFRARFPPESHAVQIAARKGPQEPRFPPTLPGTGSLGKPGAEHPRPGHALRVRLCAHAQCAAAASRKRSAAEGEVGGDGPP